MQIELKIGTRILPLTLPDARVMGVLMPDALANTNSSEAELIHAMNNPIASPRLSELAKPGQKIAIITSDITRPCPSHLMLPPVLAELEKAGIPKADIIIVFALGTHRKHTKEEIITLVGEEIYARYSCIDGDSDTVVEVGVTSAGTPLDVFTPVAKADVRICLGNIEYHYFAGYSGGDKAIMPGVSTQRSIQANHKMMTEPGAATGNLINNPVRADIEELERFLSVDFILNVVLGPKKEILKAIAGHHIKAHREGCVFLDSLYKFPLQQAADIVIVSAGGFPKDINMYQAQKALDNARFAVREGGVIILVAACPEGYGSATFERWIQQAESPEQIIRDIQINFELGGHKAAAIALALKKAKVFCVSDMPEALVRSLFFEPYASIEEALHAAEALCGTDSKILVMPIGGATLPIIKHDLL